MRGTIGERFRRSMKFQGRPAAPEAIQPLSDGPLFGLFVLLCLPFSEP